MYTIEEKQRAVELYVKYGKKGAAVRRELGYPKSRQQLLAWFREWEANAGSFPEPGYGKYTDEQKRAAVEHYLTHGRCNSFTRSELGYPGCWKVMADWVDELAPGERRTSEPRTFTAAQRAEAVEAPLTREVPAAEVAEAVGTSRRDLYAWKRRLAGEEVPCRTGAKRKAGPATPGEVSELERRRDELLEEVRRLELRRDVLEKTAELLGKGLGTDPKRLPDRDKAGLIGSLRGAWKLRELLAELEMPRSSHRYQVSAASAPDRDADAREAVREVFERSDGTYGRRRVRDELAAGGVAVGERRAARIMREESLVARTSKRRRHHGSYRGEVSEHPGNLVGHDFSAALPNFLWLTDVTEFSIPAGKLYLSPVLDCFDGAIVSWVTSTSPNAEMANSMLESALATVGPGEASHLVVHSDCGCHYRWPGWIAICEGAGLRRSMSRKGCSPDNSRMEGFFGTMKVEMFYGRDWSGATLEDLARAIDDYIWWYNGSRVKRSLGGVSPAAYREAMGFAV